MDAWDKLAEDDLTDLNAMYHHLMNCASMMCEVCYPEIHPRSMRTEIHSPKECMKHQLLMAANVINDCNKKLWEMHKEIEEFKREWTVVKSHPTVKIETSTTYTDYSWKKVPHNSKLEGTADINMEKID